MVDRPVRITFAEMRDSGVRGILVYCTDYRCSHSTALMADHWPGDVRLSDIEPRFVCKAEASATPMYDPTSIGIFRDRSVAWDTDDAS
jgi:hypothetical protein